MGHIVFKKHLDEADANPIHSTLPGNMSMMIFKMQKKMSKYFVPCLRTHLWNRRGEIHKTSMVIQEIIIRYVKLQKIEQALN